MMTYPIVEIFASLQGEGFYAGSPAVFVRFWGCENKCSFCDTKYAWATLRSKAAKELTPKELVETIRSFDLPRVVLTGGEPLLYDLQPLTEELIFAGNIKIELETSGAIPVPGYLYELQEVWCTVSPKPATNWEAHESWISQADAWKFLVDESFTLERPMKVLSNPLCPVWGERIFLVPVAPPNMNPDSGPLASQVEIERTIEFLMQRPALFRLSFQLHKFLRIK